MADLIDEVRKAKESLAAHLTEAEKILCDAGEVRILTRPGDQLLVEALDRDTNKRLLDQAVRVVFGEAATWRSVTGRGRAAEPAQQGEPAERDAALDNPTVQHVLDIFQGTVESIERREDG